VQKLLDMIIDGAMLPDVIMPLTSVLHDTFINVQCSDPQTNVNPRLWKLLESYVAAIAAAAKLAISGGDGWHEDVMSDRSTRSSLRHVFDEIMPMLSGFLELHFDRRSIVASECRTDAQVDEFLLGAHAATQRLYDKQPVCMSPSQARSMLLALRLLARAADQPAPACIARAADQPVPAGVERAADQPADGGGTPGAAGHRRRVQPVSQAQDFFDCVHTCARHDDSTSVTKQGMRDCSNRIKALTRLADPVTDEIRYEPLLKKLIRHAQDLLVISAGRKSLGREYHASVLWILRLFRTMIEDEWGFTYEARDNDGDENSDAAAWPVQSSLAECGACELCINLIANGIDRQVVIEALRLLVALLLREGGSPVVQSAMNQHFMSDKGSSMFFFKLNDMLGEILLWADVCDKMNIRRLKAAKEKANNDSNGSGKGSAVGGDDARGDEEVERGAVPDMLVMQLMQLLCEGHYLPNQLVIGSFQFQSFNLMETMVDIVTRYSLIRSRSSTAIVQITCKSILEALQGPCVENQEHLAFKTELMEILNALLCTEIDSDQDEAEEAACRLTALKIFKALMEAQQKPSLVIERLMSVVHAESLTRHLKVPLFLPLPLPLT
jgi:hypothetical protein